MRNLQRVVVAAIVLSCLAPGAVTSDEPTPPARLIANTEPLVTQAVVAAPVSEVWTVFSTGEGFKKLGVAQCEMDFRIGGLIRSHYDPKGTLGDEGTIQNEILSFEPERMVSFRIQKPPRGFPFSEATWKNTWSVVTLENLGNGGTHVRLAGMGYPDTEEGRKMRQFFETGNAFTLRLLQSRFDTKATAPNKPAHAADPLAPVEIERVIKLPRDEVWNLLTTGEGWKRTMGVNASIELRPGGKFEILFNSSAPVGQAGSEGCTVLSFLPGRMLSYTWNAPPKFSHARSMRTWVVVLLDELAPTRTLVHLEQLGFAERAAENPDHRSEWEQVRDYFDKAWGKVLDATRACEVKR